MLIEPEQIRAARAMLGWSQQELAEAAGVSKDTVKNYELSNNRPNSKTLVAMEAALVTAGIEFPRDGGVRPIKGRIRRIEGSEGFRHLMDLMYETKRSKPDLPIMITNIKEDLFNQWLGDYEPYHRERMNNLNLSTPLKVILEKGKAVTQSVDYLDIRYIDKKYFGNTTIYCINKYVAILEMTRHNCILNIIENEFMHDTFLKLLTLMWDNADLTATDE